jgi:hypothetical protein
MAGDRSKAHASTDDFLKSESDSDSDSGSDMKYKNNNLIVE